MTPQVILLVALLLCCYYLSVALVVWTSFWRLPDPKAASSFDPLEAARTVEGLVRLGPRPAGSEAAEEAAKMVLEAVGRIGQR